MPGVANLITELEGRLRPLEVEVGRAWWEFSTRTSEETDRRRQEAELRLREALSDRDTFAAVSDARQGAARGSLERRRLDVLFQQMQPNQLDADLRRRIVELETKVEGVYNTHRGEIDGERVNDNRIEEILLNSDDVDLRRKAWEASKSVGGAVAGMVLDLVRLRNEAARSLGYRDHYAMALALDDLDEDRLLATLDEVDAATAAPFAEWKGRLDAERAGRFGCAVGDLRPWHYDDPFFQEPPRVAGLDLDEHFAAADLESLTLRTYEGLGLDVRPVMEQSDLYSREGKSQHAFCIHIDREGDVRVLSNNVPNERWASTMLHEFGHAAYDRYIDVGLPFVLRAPSHMLATEAVAMLFGRRSRDPDWLAGVGGMSADRLERTRAVLAETQRGAGLVFARWALVVVQFERGLYHDPDADHDRRWWDLVERHQCIARPESRSGRAAGDGAVGSPDWAAKIHLAVAPVYYQNYLYGELMASQLDAALKACAGGVVNRVEAGKWLVEHVFRPGAAKRWDELVADATGEPLSARHFVAQVSV